MEQQHQSPVERRLMQVKVLYTFNDDPKSNCLARCPQPLSIQTAHLDSCTEIGIIELRTCIQAIAAASPELVAKLGQDFTVYAYDYSEYETPLVGQGMLSWILASASSTPLAPAHQSRTMVTGKVCKNALGLFSGGSKETLEVKLRLVPVPTCLQSEYLASMEKYRSAGTSQGAATEGSPEAAAWLSLLETSPSFNHTALSLLPPPNSQLGLGYPQNNASTLRPAAPSRPGNDASGFDPTHNTLFSDAHAQALNSSYDYSLSRPSTPSQQPQHASQSQNNKRNTTTSRPSSRNSMRGRPSMKQSQSCSSRVELNQAETSDAEDGPRRKRARITKTDWNGSSNFGMTGDSLRVTAAAAASMRGHRLAGNPLTSDIAAGELGQRPPTPRPRSTATPKPVPSFPRSLTSTADELTTHSQPVPRRPYSNDPLGILAESSPEKNDPSSMESTPMDMPSSPPVVRTASPTPSSPSLPNLRFRDSGFDSGNFDEYMAEYDKFEASNAMRDTNSRNDEPSDLGLSETALPVDPNTLGRKLIPGPPPPPQTGRAESAAPSSPGIPFGKRAPKPRTASMSAATSNKRGFSDGTMDDKNVVTQSLEARVALLSAAAPSNDYRVRSESCLTDFGSQDGSPPKGDEHDSKRIKTVTHEKKKQAIRARLAESIKAGAMPRFCKNCGEIKTPSWRKAFVRIERGDPEKVKLSEDEAGIHSWEAIDRAEDGGIESYRIVKKKIAPGDTDYEEIELCNPCGIWLFKNKVMRPQEAWDKQGDPKARRKSSTKKKSGEDDDQAKGPGTESESSILPEEQKSGNDSGSVVGEQARGRGTVPHSRPIGMTQRASSLGPLNRPSSKEVAKKQASAQAALQRAIQSSPPRFPGSQKSPIEIDLELECSPRPTKRLLFPSPRKPGEIKSLDHDLDKKPSPCGRKDKHGNTLSTGMPEDRKNELLAADNHQDAVPGDLFDDDAHPSKTPDRTSLIGVTHQTPSRSSRKTPLTSRDFMSSGGRRRRHSNPSTPSRVLGNASLLAGQQMTPFTAHLTQLLSESNGADGISLDSYALDDTGIFNYSDFGSGDASGNFAFLEHPHTSNRDFWEGNSPFDESIEAYLNASTPRKCATEAAVMPRIANE